ncbi:MAG TPA: phosphoribosyltransferase family protein, partial [Solirubrobacterales bacterium]|nr:phosphoribosyltransferase family protein [Solirubrobacterales bacterium]
MNEKVVLEHDDLRRTLRRIAHEIAEKNPDSEHLAVVGIHTRGAVLARRLHVFLGELTGNELPIGDLDISFYRDDVGAKSPAAQPVVHASHIDFDLSERTVVLVDDVLYR